MVIVHAHVYNTIRLTLREVVFFRDLGIACIARTVAGGSDVHMYWYRRMGFELCLEVLVLEWTLLVISVVLIVVHVSSYGDGVR